VIKIRFPKRDAELGRHRVDVIPDGRDALVVWHDQFGTTHMAAFGSWAKRQNAIEAALRPVLDS
jgi:hypothetical protein